MEKVTKHYNPQPSAVVQHFKFNLVDAAPGETSADYVAEVKKLSKFCEFGGALYR